MIVPDASGAGLPRSEVVSGVAVFGSVPLANTRRSYLVTIVAWSADAWNATPVGRDDAAVTVMVAAAEVALAPALL